MDDLTAARMALFPVTASNTSGKLTIAGCDLVSLAEEFGTPVYIFDERTIETALDDYRQALARHYPGSSAITYAGKAFLCTALAQWMAHHDVWLDCTGAGELSIAAVADVPRKRILVHGINKSEADLEAALASAAVIVVDNLTELTRLAQMANQGTDEFPELWLRIRPGLPVDTHAYRQTGQDDSKFGMSYEEAAQALQFGQDSGLQITGVHFHQGSHFHDPAPLAPALDRVLDFIADVGGKMDWMPATICPGGGWGVPYHEDDLADLGVERYVQFVARHLVDGCQRRGLSLPTLHLEPGRSLVARAGVAVYRVGAVKRTANRRWLLLDGGMADNIRPALYGARYSALPVTGLERPATEPAWLGGPYCESGDILIQDLPLPEMAPGELVAIPVSGAYHLSMASNYNGARRPAVLWAADGQAWLIQRRESLADLTRRDLPLPPGRE